MSEIFHSILGLPGSGKTTFLAALWHLIDAGEVTTKLELDKLVGDHTHLNTIVDLWRRCAEMRRTSIPAEANVSIHIHEPETGQKIVLSFADLSGESFEHQFALRKCKPEYVSGLAGAGGILLFVNADRAQDGMTLLDLNTALADIDGDVSEEVSASLTADATGELNAGDEPSPLVAKAWSHAIVPEQVQLVDILQFLLQPPFVRRRRRIAVGVSAWDVITQPELPPQAWLARELPLLHQFLETNPDSFEFRVYGISAQGGDVSGPRRDELLRMTPSERIQCFGPETDPHDLTAPILWLSRDP